MSKFCVLRAKTYSFLIDGFTDEDYVKNGIVNKKAKGTKKCVVKHTITFNNYVQALFNDKKILRTQYTFRSDHHKVYTQKINKIALSNNDDKRIKPYDKITSCPYGYIENANNTSKILKEEVYANNIRNSSSDVRNELKILREQAQAIKNRSEVFREEANTIRNTGNNDKTVKTPSKVLLEEAQANRINSKVLRKDAYAIYNIV